MSIRRTFPVLGVGAGRRDHSKAVEYAVEAMIRSHLRRHIWYAHYDGLASVAFPNYNSVGPLQFLDADGNVVFYAPDDVTYFIYDVKLTGDYTALTGTSIEKFTWPGLVFVETVTEIYGYGEAEIKLTKGHKCEPGRAYALGFTQWSEKATYSAQLIAHGMADVVVG